MMQFNFQSLMYVVLKKQSLKSLCCKAITIPVILKTKFLSDFGALFYFQNTHRNNQSYKVQAKSN